MENFYNITYFFSYWIFFWFFLYYFGYFTEYNPRFALLVGFIFEFLLFVLMVYNGVSNNFVLFFIFTQVFIKMIPLYLIWNKPIHLISDLKATVILFLFYLAWLYLNNINIIEYSIKIFYNLGNGIINTPLMNFINKNIIHLKV
jgi:hypothetical protein